MGQVMLAVRPNWAFASAARVNLSCVVRVSADMQGKVLLAQISRGSGNAQFDASAVNAVVRTGQSGQFPPPPSQEYANLDLVFTLDELMGR
jgi:TonB family protein